MLSSDTRKRDISARSWSKPSSEKVPLPPLNIKGAKSTRIEYMQLGEINTCFLPPVESLLFHPPNSVGPPCHCPAPQCCQALCHSNVSLCCCGAHAGPCLHFFSHVCSSQPIATAPMISKQLHYPLRSLTCMCIITTSLTITFSSTLHYMQVALQKPILQSTWSFQG